MAYSCLPGRREIVRGDWQRSRLRRRSRGGCRFRRHLGFSGDDRGRSLSGRIFLWWSLPLVEMRRNAMRLPIDFKICWAM